MLLNMFKLFFGKLIYTNLATLKIYQKLNQLQIDFYNSQCKLNSIKKAYEENRTILCSCKR